MFGLWTVWNVHVVVFPLVDQSNNLLSRHVDPQQWPVWHVLFYPAVCIQLITVQTSTSVLSEADLRITHVAAGSLSNTTREGNIRLHCRQLSDTSESHLQKQTLQISEAESLSFFSCVCSNNNAAC